MPIENVDAVMAELDEEIKASGEDKFGNKPKPEEEDEEQLEEEPKQPVEGGEDDGEDEENEEELAAAAISDDPKKRNGVFGKFRKENKELRAQLDAARAEQAQKEREFAERLARIEGRHEAMNPPKTPVVEKDDEPDRILYPDDHRDWQLRQIQKQNEELRKNFQAVQQFQQETAKERAVSDLEAAYRATNPSDGYDDAVKFLWEREKANMKILRPQMTDAQIDLQIKADKVKLFEMLYSQGNTQPAAVLVQLAKNAGWTGATTTTQQQSKTGGEKLRKLADNQRRTSNLIGGSPASKGGASSDDVLNMSLKKAMMVAHRNPSAFDGDYGDN